MKKVLLALSALGVFALAGCSSDSESTTSTVGGEMQSLGTKIDLAKPETLQGTYRIEYFASTAKAGGASSDWSKLDKFKNVLDETRKMKKGSDVSYPDAKGNFYGEATISLYNNNLKIVSKLQMKDPSFTTGSVSIMLKPQQYNYTKYTDIPTTNIDITNNTINKGGSSVNGVTGRNAKENKPNTIGSGQEKANSYYFKLHTDGKLYHYMKDNSVMEADVLVVLTKQSDTPKTLAKDAQYTKEETGKDLDLGQDFVASPSNKE